jgi:hypothetical protein
MIKSFLKCHLGQRPLFSTFKYTKGKKNLGFTMHVEYLLSLLTDEQRVLFVPVTRVNCKCEAL